MLGPSDGDFSHKSSCVKQKTSAEALVHVIIYCEISRFVFERGRLYQQ